MTTSEKGPRDIEQVENGGFTPPSTTDTNIVADSGEDPHFEFTIWKFIAIVVRMLSPHSELSILIIIVPSNWLYGSSLRASTGVCNSDNN